MSIISDALRKANQEKRRPEPKPESKPQAQPAKDTVAYTPSDASNSRGFWGYIVVLLIFIVPLSIYLLKPQEPSDAMSFISSSIASTQNADESPAAVGNAQVAVEQAPIKTIAAMLPKPAPRYALHGIMTGQSGNYAIVNHEVVRVGDEIDGAQIKKISDREVVLTRGDRDIVLSNTF